jgi:hypothetical protein
MSDALLKRIRSEFLEMPGLRLTGRQAQRLWDVDATSCDALLETLIQTGFLFRTRDGSFMRVERPQAVRVRHTPRKPAAVA